MSRLRGPQMVKRLRHDEWVASLVRDAIEAARENGAAPTDLGKRRRSERAAAAAYRAIYGQDTVPTDFEGTCSP